MPKGKPRSCITCNIEKEVKLYRKGKMICKQCEKDPNLTYKQLCNSCNIEKENIMFRMNRKKCIDCERKYGRNYRKTTTKAKEWVELNRERMSELQHNYYESNKLTIREKQLEKYYADPILEKYRKSIPKFIRGSLKTIHWINISRENYIKWLEFCFTDEFTMNNYANEWNVDHVLPLNMLKSNVIVKANNYSRECLFSWYNTTPVKYKVNLRKNKYLDRDQLINHMYILEQFIKRHLEIKIDEKFNIYKNIVNTILTNQH